MRILLDGRRLEAYPTGIGRYITEYARALSRQDVDLSIAAGNSFSPAAHLARDLRLPVVLVGKELSAWPNDTKQFDLVHLTYPLVRPPKSVPYVCTIYDLLYMHPEWASLPKRTVYRQWIRPVVRGARHIIAISTFAKSELIKYFPSTYGKVSVAPLAPSLSYDPKVSAPENTTGALVYVGNLRPHKGLETLVDALALLPHQQLVIFTADEPKRLLWLAGQRQVAHQIQVLRNKPDKVLAAAMKASFAVVCPSHYEGSGLPLIDAAALGVPIIATRIPAYNEVLGDEGWRFTPGDLSGLVACVKGLLATDPSARAQSSLGNRSWDNVAGQISSVYYE